MKTDKTSGNTRYESLCVLLLFGFIGVDAVRTLYGVAMDTFSGRNRARRILNHLKITSVHRVRIPYTVLYYYNYKICIFINIRMSAASWGICALRPINIIRADYCKINVRIM